MSVTENGYLKTDLIDVDGYDGVECENCKERYVIGFTRKIEFIPYLFAIIISVLFGAFLHSEYQNHLIAQGTKDAVIESSDYRDKWSNIGEATLEMTEMELILTEIGDDIFQDFEIAITYAGREDKWVGLMTMEPRTPLEKEYFSDTPIGVFKMMKEALLQYKMQQVQFN